MLETSRQDILSHSLRTHIIIIICVRIHSLSAEMSVVISFVLLKLAVLLAPYFESLVWLCLSALLLLPLPTRKLNGEPVIPIHHNSSILMNWIFIPFHCISILVGHKFTSLGHWAVAFFFYLAEGKPTNKKFPSPCIKKNVCLSPTSQSCSATFVSLSRRHD